MSKLTFNKDLSSVHFSLSSYWKPYPVISQPVPSKLLYADNLVITTESLDELANKFLLWKHGLEARGLKVNMKKTKVMISGLNLNTLRDAGKYPCGICRKGVGSNSIFWNDCKHWVHKKCTNIRGRLSAVPNFRCGRCFGLARPIVGKHTMMCLLAVMSLIWLTHFVTSETTYALVVAVSSPP